ncbi:hypothetical protein KMP13_11640 [Epibacterium ulvae]|uniref:calcium-binding protein n=1 Tax=Epibacterium ulvae TaxID=1156985 RepID=UPI001BFCC9F5|nr:calcium-binding protein [Epibacterium ulvae]MBT8154539.1 hypothetical protein [Epibacterium ulvae]
MDFRFYGGFGKAQGVADLLLVPGAGGAYLVAVERLGGGLRSYGTATLTERDYRPHQGANLLTGAAVALGGDSGRLLLAGSDLARLDSHLVSSSGTIAAQTSWSLPGLAQGAEVSTLTSTTSQGQALVYGVADGALRGWQVSETGSASAVARSGGAAPYGQAGSPGPVALDVVTTGSSQILVAADAGLGGLRSYRIAAGTGALTPADELGRDQGLGIAAPTAVDAIIAYGQAWVVLAAAGTSSLSVMAVAANGDLTLVDHAIDSLGSRFGQVTAVESFVVDGHAFVLVAGGDGGMDLLRLLPSGHLVQAAQVLHAPGQGLQNVTAIETRVTGDTVSIFVASEGGLNADGEGIARYGFSRAALGQVATASAATLSGTAGDDLLIGNGTATTITGGAGDDMLVASAPGDRLEGGAGADFYVIAPGRAGADRDRVVIAGFEPGHDQLDLSLLEGLRSLSQLQVEARHNGIDLHWQGGEIRVESRDGGSLSLTDLWPQGWKRAHHLPLGETLPATADDDTVVSGGGSDGSVTLVGGGGDDRLAGQAGADVLEGGAGRDHLLGAAGNDTLRGGAGGDQLEGGDGADQLDGGRGNDTLIGGNGADQLLGGDGADRLDGGQGADTLRGEAGADHIFGDQDDDFLWGGSGNDSLFGGSGADQLWGEAGHDVLQGGGGSDAIHGAAGRDSIWGGGGHDDIWGGAGRDQIWGKNGADDIRGNGGQDTIQGQQGNDAIYGDAGADVLNGNGGHDDIWGGAGRDRVSGGNKGDHLRGGRGDDRLYGQRGHDLLEGQQGDDRLRGGTGNDTLRGGLGADVFIFDDSNGRDWVLDFTQGEDVLHLRFLRREGAQRLSDVGIHQNGVDLVLDIGTGQITLADQAGLQLEVDDFLF